MKFRKGAGIIGVVSLLLGAAAQSGAVDGLQLSLQCSNVVLTWPTVDGGGDTFIIRRRPDLSTNSSWTCLTNAYPAATGSGLTVFVDSNVVLYPNCSTGGFGTASPAFRSGGSQSSALLGTARLTRFSPALNSANLPPLPPMPPSLVSTASMARQSLNGVSTGSFALTEDSGGRLPEPLGAGASSGASSSQTADAEFYQVVKVGVHLLGITNGMVLSGQVPLNVEFGNLDTNGTLTALYVTDTDPDGANGTISGASFPYFPNQPTNYFSGVWDTTQVTNGTYTILLGGILDDGTLYEDYPVSVTVSNLAWLIDPYNVGGAALYLGVQTPYTDGTGTWRVDAYDDQGTHIGYFPGIIDANGYLSYPGNPGIGLSIGNTDGNGNQNPSTSYTLVYSADAAHPLSATPPYEFTNSQRIELPWKYSPTWSTVCYMDIFHDGKPIAQTQALDMMRVVAGTESIYHPLEIGDTLNVFQVGMNGTWFDVQAQGISQTVSRDFVYFGHGSPTLIGSGTTVWKSSDVAYYLQNDGATGGNPLNGVIYHPYRFVFLDGCDTAEGDWPTAFGIPKKTGMVITDFTNKRGIRPRAFMGWKKTKAIGLLDSGLMNNAHIDYITTFWQAWASLNPSTGQLTTVSEAIKAAQKETLSDGTVIDNPEREGMVLYGAQNLTLAQ